MNSCDGDGSGLFTSISFTRHTFVFTDMSRLLITEHLSRGRIEIYFYDWVDEHGADILKFHSEPHKDDRRYQTSTEPYHIHPPADAKLTNMTRYPNVYHQELPAIMEHIFFSLVAAKKI